MRKKHTKQSGTPAGAFWAGKGLDCHYLPEKLAQKHIFNHLNDQFTADIFQVTAIFLKI